MVREVIPIHIRLKIYKRILRIMEQGSKESACGIMLTIIENTSFSRYIQSYVEIWDTLQETSVLVSWFVLPTDEKIIKRMKRIIKKTECK